MDRTILEVITVIFQSHRPSADSTFRKLEEESKAGADVGFRVKGGGGGGGGGAKGRG